MKNVKKILAPIDLSARSRPAVEHAINIANHFGAEVIVLHAIPSVPYDAALASGYPGGWAWNLSDEREQQVAEIVDNFLREVIPGKTIKRIVVRGEAAQLIKEAVEQLNIDLVVMPTSGAGAFRRFLLGSTTTKVLSDVDCPVLTGAHVDEISAFAPRPYKKVGCALDLGEGSETVAAKAQEFAMGYHAKVLPMHTVQFYDGAAQLPPQRLENVPTDSLLGRAKAATKKVLTRARVPADPVVELGAPEQVIPEISEREDVDLLVVGRHNSDGVFQGLMTHAYGLIRNAPCPVLSV